MFFNQAYDVALLLDGYAAVLLTEWSEPVPYLSFLWTYSM